MGVKLVLDVQAEVEGAGRTGGRGESDGEGGTCEMMADHAERSLLSLQGQRAESDGTVTSNLITLYKALGGGW
ncbi:MAG: hypothetical protein MUE73_22000, partial [Planctomycetes bacterium]|nr:hypothetical protein [Planctomycetota bacterium]